MASELLASAARTASGNGSAITYNRRLGAARFFLDVTAAASAVGDTLDVYIQSSLDGVVWDDFVHFTQVLGNGGAKQFVASWIRTLAPTTAQRAPRDATLAAGVEQGPIGNQMRVKWVIVNGGGSHSFTFSLQHEPYRMDA